LLVNAMVNILFVLYLVTKIHRIVPLSKKQGGLSSKN